MSENFSWPFSNSLNCELSLNWPQTPRVIVCSEVQSAGAPSKIMSMARPLKETDNYFNQNPALKMNEILKKQQLKNNKLRVKWILRIMPYIIDGLDDSGKHRLLIYVDRQEKTHQC